MSASLGGLLKDYRLKRNLSQIEIAFSLGWKDTSRLSRIEQGRVGNPPRDLLDRLMESMRLEEEEKNELLLIGGYLPTEKEIDKIRIATEIVNVWPYSSILFDFSWRVVHFNKNAIDLYGIDGKTEMYIRNNHPNIIEIVFDLNFTQNKKLQGRDKEKWREFLIYFLLRFRYAQRARSKEKWYITLIQRLMDNPLFRDIWMETQKTKPLSIYNFGTIIPIIHPNDKNKRLSLYFSMVPLLKDPRFELELDTPGDIETFKYFENKK